MKIFQLKKLFESLKNYSKINFDDSCLVEILVNTGYKFRMTLEF
jgi:hypothetical protein